MENFDFTIAEKAAITVHSMIKLFFVGVLIIPFLHSLYLIIINDFFWVNFWPVLQAYWTSIVFIFSLTAPVLAFYLAIMTLFAFLFRQSFTRKRILFGAIPGALILLSFLLTIAFVAYLLITIMNSAMRGVDLLYFIEFYLSNAIRYFLQFDGIDLIVIVVESVIYGAIIIAFTILSLKTVRYSWKFLKNATFRQVE